MHKITLSQLGMLVAVADAGSFSKAAQELGCTQSRISHAVGELEKQLGARLLERAHAGSVPTSEGQRALLKARQILALVEDMRTPPEDTHTGLVRLACVRSVSTHVMPYVLPALARRHPGIRLEIDDSCRDVDAVALAVASGSADIGIGCAPYEEEFAVRPMMHDDWLLVVPASLSLRQPFGWEQLDGVPLIEPAMRCAGAVIAQYRADGLHARTTHRLTNDSSIMAMVAVGQGFSVFPRLATLPLPPGVAIATPPLAFRREFGILALPATARMPLMRTVTRFLRDKRMLMNTPACRAGLISPMGDA